MLGGPGVAAAVAAVAQAAFHAVGAEIPRHELQETALVDVHELLANRFGRSQVAFDPQRITEAEHDHGGDRIARRLGRVLDVAGERIVAVLEHLIPYAAGQPLDAGDDRLGRRW